MTVPEAAPGRGPTEPRPGPRGPRAVLMTVGLFLIPLLALWLLLAPHLQLNAHHGGGPLSAREQAQRRADPYAGLMPPGAPAPPPPRLVAGSAVQAGWTLLGASSVPPSGFPVPPPLRGVPPGRVPFLRAGPGSVGLWVGVRGGVGVKTLTIPADGRRHAFPFGRFSLVAEPALTHHGGAFAAVRWEGPGDPSALPPYALSSSYLGVGGRAYAQTVTLTPTPFAAQFRVTARPLSAEGRPTGGAVRLLCQPATPDALFIPIPAGYSAATRQFRVSVARAGGKAADKESGSASWLISGLPPTAAPSALVPARPTARIGPFSLRLSATEAEDTGGYEDPANPRPAQSAGPAPTNTDQHLRTGVPTLHYVLTAQAASPPAPGQTWLLQLDRAAPQWAAPPDPSALGRPLALLPLTAYAWPPSVGWVLQDGAVGAAYPGQQHWLTLQGSVIRQGTRTESVTFHDAEVVRDAGFGGDRLVWRHPETETTASGIRITVLNGRPGRRDTGGELPSGSGFGQGFGQGFGRDWWYDRANAELLVAWRLPRGVLPWAHAPLDSPRVASLGAMGKAPAASGALLASPDTIRPDPYAGAAHLPGGGDARVLTRAGYSLLRLSVWAAQTPTRVFSAAPAPLPPNSWREGPFVASGRPLPRRLPSLTLFVTFREEKERRALRLVVPVRAAPHPPATPPWNGSGEHDKKGAAFAALGR